MDPIVVGVVVGLPATGLGWLGYRRSIRLDRLAVQAATIKEGGTTTQTIIDGLDRMIVRLQEDNRILRERIEDYSKQLRRVEDELRELKYSLLNVNEERKKDRGGAT